MDLAIENVDRQDVEQQAIRVAEQCAGLAVDRAAFDVQAKLFVAFSLVSRRPVLVGLV